MKKILVLFVLLFVTSMAIAQTYEQTQERVSTEVDRLEKRLIEIQNEIYYLDVSLDQKIVELEAKSSKKKYLSAEIDKLKKEKYFSVENLISLKAEKKKLEEAIKNLKTTGLGGVEHRTGEDMESNLPEKMSTREFNRRNRSQSYRALENYYKGSKTGSESSIGLDGLLVNYKTGRYDIVVFTINRIDIRVPVIGTYALDPKERLSLKLLPGTYRIDASGSKTSKTFRLDPQSREYVDGRWVSWSCVATY